MTEQSLPVEPEPFAAMLEAHFPIYAQDKSRSLLGVSRALSISLLVVTRHAKKYGWERRLANLATRKVTSPDALTQNPQQAVTAVNLEQLNVAEKLLSKGLGALETLDFTRPADALKAIDMAIELKRQAVGADGSQQQDMVDLIMGHIQRLTERQITPETPTTPVRITLEPAQTEPPRLLAAAQDEFKLDEAFLEEAGRGIPDDIERGAEPTDDQ